MRPANTIWSETDQLQGKRFKFIGCEIIYREVCLLAARSRNVIDLEFLRKGLHDMETADMVAELQQAVDRADADCNCEAILLGYARCNDGTVGLRAGTRRAMASETSRRTGPDGLSLKEYRLTCAEHSC